MIIDEKQQAKLEKVKRFLDKEGFEYSTFGPGDPICISIKKNKKNHFNQKITNTKGIRMYLFISEYDYLYIFYDIYNLKGKKKSKIDKALDDLNKNNLLGEDYRIDSDGMVYMEMYDRLISEEAAVKMLSMLKEHLFDASLLRMIFY